MGKYIILELGVVSKGVREGKMYKAEKTWPNDWSQGYRYNQNISQLLTVASEGDFFLRLLVDYQKQLDN